MIDKPIPITSTVLKLFAMPSCVNLAYCTRPFLLSGWDLDSLLYQLEFGTPLCKNDGW